MYNLGMHFNYLTSVLSSSTLFGLQHSFTSPAIGCWPRVRQLQSPQSACTHAFVFSAVFTVHACSFLAVVHAEKELAERASSRPQYSLPLLTTALRVDDGLMAFPGAVETTTSNGFFTSFPTTERPLSSDSTEIAEVHRKSKESGVLAC